MLRSSEPPFEITLLEIRNHTNVSRSLLLIHESVPILSSRFQIVHGNNEVTVLFALKYIQRHSLPRPFWHYPLVHHYVPEYSHQKPAYHPQCEVPKTSSLMLVEYSEKFYWMLLDYWVVISNGNDHMVCRESSVN